MIKEIREQEPFIHFGFNKQNITAYVGQDIIIWQDKIYINDYDESIVSIGATIVSTTLNKSVVNYSSVGTYTLTFNVQDKDKAFTKSSNELTINVL